MRILSSHLVQWFVKRLNNENYTIQNFHKLFATPEKGYFSKRGTGIVGRSDSAQWSINEMPSKGDYWYVPIVFSVCYDKIYGVSVAYAWLGIQIFVGVSQMPNYIPP